MFCKYRYIYPLLILAVISISSCKKKKEADFSYDNIKTEVSSTIVSKPSQSEQTSSGEIRRIKVRNIGALQQVFNDSNYIQMDAAYKLGITPLAELSDYYFTKRPLIKVKTNENYQVDSLTHSLPFLVPEAAGLLNDIGRNFKDSLKNRGGDSYTIRVTSLLRTPETVGKLRQVNINATDSSTHLFGTTFDISYTNFNCQDANKQIYQGDLKNLLGEVLKDLRDQGRCFVKYEIKTACYHVTVR